MDPLTKPKLIFIGYFGAENIGDEAILSAQITKLKPYFDMRVLGLNPGSTQNKYRVKCARLPTIRKPEEISELFKTIAWADALVVGGGGFLADKLQPLSTYYWLYIMAVAKLLRKRVILFAIGCGPFKKGISSLLVKFMLNKSDAVILRDSMSEEFIKQIGAKIPTKVTADISFLPEPPASNPSISLEQVIKHSYPPRVLFVLCQRLGRTHTHSEKAIPVIEQIYEKLINGESRNEFQVQYP